MKNEDNETEILLGNKQLLGIFFVVAVLLGVAFTGGYMVGHGSNKKAPTPSEAAAPETSKTSVGETHSVGADSGTESPSSGAEAPPDENAQAATAPEQETSGTRDTKSTGKRAHKNEERASASEETSAPASTTSFTPRAGQTFLQVAAVGRTEAEAVADVLHKKGFRAHAVPKPGTKVYRVLIGPVRDTADLSATRDSLRRTGFRDVIVQRY